VLLPHQVIPFLQHDDVAVREHAARYLSEAHDPSPATADDFWRSIDRFGAKASLALVADLTKLRSTERSYARLMEALRSGPDEVVEFHLQHVVQTLDLPLVLAHREELLSAEPILSHVRDHLRQRIELAGRPLDAVWETLLSHSERIDGMCVGEFDRRESERLIEAAARHGEAAAARALDRLRNGPRDDWMEIFCVRLLGEVRFEPAAGVLIERLRVDADLLPDDVGRALTRIGTVDVIERLEAFYPGKAWYVQMGAGVPLGRIKRPEADRALLRMLPQQPDEGLATQLAEGLCDLCTTEGLGVVEGMVAEERYDSQYCELDAMFLTVATMTGYDPRCGPQLRGRVEQRRREREKRMKSGSLEGMLREMRDEFRRGEFAPRATDEEDADPGYGDEAELSAWGDETYPPPPGGTLRREAPKIGRNDPCPCGSGTKYKKCCLSAAKA
jgi:hypothetical protein